MPSTNAAVGGTADRDWIHVSGDGHNPSDGFNEIALATDHADTITGGDGDDVIYAGGGTDTIDGGLGADAIFGGDGADTITGGAGGNTIDGGGGNDTIDAGTGGDTANGGDGNDVIFGSGAGQYHGDAGDDVLAAGTSSVGATYDGGDGTDVLRLDYAGSVNEFGFAQTVLAGATLSSIEGLKFNEGHNAAAIFGAQQIGGGLSANATITGSADIDEVLFVMSAPGTYDFSANHFKLVNWTVGQDLVIYVGAGPGPFSITGSSGSEVILGSMGIDTLMPGTGSDVANGGGGNDVISFTTGFDAGDILIGGDGYDKLQLSGNYNVVMKAGTLATIEEIDLASSFNYNLTTANANVAAGASLVVDASALGTTKTLTFDGSGEKDGSFNIVGGRGADVLIGGAQDDTFNLAKGGADNAAGGSGNDTFVVGATWDAVQQIDGGAGSDRLEFSSNTTTVLGATSISNVESFVFDAGFNYSLTVNDANVAAGKNFTVDATALAGANKLFFYGSAETNAKFTITGGAGGDILNGGALADTISGGAGNDRIVGGLGGDRLNGGGDADTFIYNATNESTGSGYDTVKSFDFAADRFDTTVKVSAIDHALTVGTLSATSFDTDLAAALDSTVLHNHRAILFTPDSGTLAGKMFLVVDVAGGAGYQSGQDLVVMLDSAIHTTSIATSNFI